jgi:hypothetical protein
MVDGCCPDGLLSGASDMVADCDVASVGLSVFNILLVV